MRNGAHFCTFSRLDAESWTVVFKRRMLAIARLQQDVWHRMCEHVHFPSKCVFAAVMSIGPPFSPSTASCRDRGGRVPDDYHNREIGDAGYSER